MWGFLTFSCFMGFPGGSDSKESACQGRKPAFDPWIRKIPWRREWLPTPVFLPGECYGQRSLVGYIPRGCKESDTTEWITLSCCFSPPSFWHQLCWQLFQHHFNNSQKHQLGVQHCVQVWRLLPRVNTVSMGGGLTPQDWPHYRWHWHIGPLEPHHSRYALLELLTEQEFDCESKHLGMTRSKLCLVVWGQLRYMARSGVTQKQQVSTPCRTSCPKHHGILIKCRLFWH